MTRTVETSTHRDGPRLQGRRPELADVYLTARQMQAQAIGDMTANAAGWLARHSGLSAAARALAGSWKSARMRRRTLTELSRLDARTLRDIGINPHDVEGAVDRLMAEQRDEQAHASLGDVIRNLDGLMAPLRRWDLSRRAAGQMARMSGETLNDLGYRRGDIDWVPENLADRTLAARAANRNQAPADEETHGHSAA